MTDSSKKILALYPDGHHEEIILGEMLNKGGAAGKIYRDNTHKGSVAKIYHDINKSETNRKKLEAMLQNRPNIQSIKYGDKDYIQIAWPTALLEDENGYCIGYLMPEIDTKEAVSLDHIIQKAVRKKLGLTERYLDRIFAAYNITSVVAALHACGHYIVDLKPSNVSIYKKTMLVALFDCDGFSIKGENNSRYPAEYVSEEYIYPEGMSQECQNMGEEQDKFALAVIIFKLLNEGIHPFSGVPRKNDDMLSIQERIAGYHYAYGIWPDAYQSPHPYSMHDYFDKNTMNLFERAFTSGNERPSAIEWQGQLEYILKHLKQCRKDKNHVYFTSKGCGLCKIQEKFKQKVENYKKQQGEPQTIRGIDVKDLQNKIKKNKDFEEQKINKYLNYAYYVFIAFYILFFTFLAKILSPVEKFLHEIGIFAQFVFIIIGAVGINYCLDNMSKIFSKPVSDNFTSMLRIYALTCLIIAFISINKISIEVFGLTQ